MRNFILIIGLLLLLTFEILRVYFIMPFPGSQKANTIDFAYWLGRNIRWIRIVLLLLIALPLIYAFKNYRWWKKILLAIPVIFYGVVFYYFNFKFEADKMFYQPQHKNFSTISNSGADTVLVIGVAINGEAKAFPIQIIGYHHQVRDTIGNTPAIITYCTVCRTGRVFSPVVNGKPETFRLVGMDHFNAMFEDATTKSWWQQATGIAVAGPLKGQALPEIPSQQLTLAAWQRLYPHSPVMEPDTTYNKRYKGLYNYNKGTIKSSLEKRDSASWKMKSWVVGVINKGAARAYDWNELLQKELIEDTLQGTPIVLALENDTASFHVWSRQLNEQTLRFTKNKATQTLTDANTNSVWNMNGECIEGPFKGSRLATMQSYQEFWHSWQNFRPYTTQNK